MKTEPAKLDKCLCGFKAAIKIGPTKKSEDRGKFMWNRMCSFGDLALEILYNGHLRFRCRQSGRVICLEW